MNINEIETGNGPSKVCGSHKHGLNWTNLSHWSIVQLTNVTFSFDLYWIFNPLYAERKIKIELPINSASRLPLFFMFHMFNIKYYLH